MVGEGEVRSKMNSILLSLSVKWNSNFGSKTDSGLPSPPHKREFRFEIKHNLINIYLYH